jgi:dihydroneopterin triphosphate diphosphatase
MARAPFQVLVFPYRALDDGDFEFAVFSRAAYRCWQGIAGGGEGEETPLQAAKRESLEA